MGLPGVSLLICEMGLVHFLGPPHHVAEGCDEKMNTKEF